MKIRMGIKMACLVLMVAAGNSGAWAANPPPVMETNTYVMEYLNRQDRPGNDGVHYWVDGIVQIRAKYNSAQGYQDGMRALDAAGWQILGVTESGSPAGGLATIFFRMGISRPGTE